MNSDENEFVESHIKYIRRMAMLDDNSLKAILKLKVSEDPSILEKFKDSKMKKQYNELSQIAKDIKTEPIKLGRKVA